MIIAVASGKGGTGKTTIATGLALSLSDVGITVSLMDCDVEAPNAHLFLQPSIDQHAPVNVQIPEVNANLCSGSGRCAEVCEFHAIVTLGGKTLVFPELCHGCGSCTLVCPEQAITEIPNQVGVLEAGMTGGGIHFSRGVLDVGEPMAVPVITQLKNWNNGNNVDLIIRDSPPGTSCPVVASISGTDYVFLVTEPTPFGLHDLRLAFELTEELGIPAGVIINRDGIGDTKIDEFCLENEIPILMRIPFERKISEGIARGKSLVEINPEYVKEFQSVFDQIHQMVNSKKVRT